MKRPIKKSKEFSKDREFAVILEKIYFEIKVIGEGHAALKDKLDSAMGMIAKNTEDITWLKIIGSGTKDDIAKINGKLAKIEDDIRIIKEGFSKRLSRLEEISLK